MEAFVEAVDAAEHMHNQMCALDDSVLVAVVGKAKDRVPAGVVIDHAVRIVQAHLHKQ